MSAFLQLAGSANLQQTKIKKMKNTPNYQKWFNGSSVVPAAEIETTTVVPGQVLARELGQQKPSSSH